MIWYNSTSLRSCKLGVYLVRKIIMKRAALGIRMHSGWGVLVILTLDAGAIELIDRRRIDVIDSGLRGGNQPYHHAKLLEISEAEQYLAMYTGACERVASPALRHVVEE